MKDNNNNYIQSFLLNINLEDKLPMDTMNISPDDYLVIISLR